MKIDGLNEGNQDYPPVFFLTHPIFRNPHVRRLVSFYLLLPPTAVHLPQMNFEALGRGRMSPTASCYETGWTDGAQIFSVSLGF